MINSHFSLARKLLLFLCQGIILPLLIITASYKFNIIAGTFAASDDNVDQISSMTAFNARKDAWYNAVFDYIGNNNEDGAVYGMLLLERSKRTGDFSRVQEANDRIVAGARYIDEGDYQGNGRPVYEGYAMDYLRVYMLFKDRSDLLFPSTKAKLLEGTEPSGSSYPNNREESFRHFQKEITYNRGRQIGLQDFNPWTVMNNIGTENHMLQEIATGLIISQIYSGETCTATDGTFPMKDNTEIVDDYWHYWKAAFYTWLTKYGDKYGELSSARHIDWGVGEKDTNNYLSVYLGDFWLMRDFVEDATVAKYSEMYLDLLLADFAEDELNGLYTGPRQRSTDYYSQGAGPRTNRTAVLSHLLFGSLPYAISPQMGFDICNWGCWAYTAIVTSQYNPTNDNFPKVIIDVDINKPIGGYEITEANGLWGSSPSNPRHIYITQDYALGFQVDNECGTQHNCGELSINDNRGINGGAIIAPYVGNDPPDYRYKPNAKNRAIVVPGAAIIQQFVTETGQTPSTMPAKLWIRDGFLEKDYTSYAPWMFFKSQATSGREIYVAVRPVYGSHTDGGSVENGEIRVFTVGDDYLVWDIADSTKYSSFSNFKSAIAGKQIIQSGSWIEYTSTSGHTIRFNRDNETNSTIDGITVNWDEYRYIVNNPWMKWQFGTREATFSRNNRFAFYDFDANNDGVFNDPAKQVNNNQPTPAPTDISTPTSLPSGSNLLINTSFESDPNIDYFTHTEGLATFTWAGDQYHTGIKSVKIDVLPSASPSSLSRWLTRNDSIPTTAGKSYTGKVYIKTSNVTGTANLTVLFLDKNTLAYLGGSSSSIDTGTNDWQERTVTSPIAPANSFVRLEMRLTGAGTVWFDDASLYETN